MTRPKNGVELLIGHVKGVVLIDHLRPFVEVEEEVIVYLHRREMGGRVSFDLQPHDPREELRRGPLVFGSDDSMVSVWGPSFPLIVVIILYRKRRPVRLVPPNCLICTERVHSHGQNAALTCRRFGVSRQTFYRWKRRYDPMCLESSIPGRARTSWPWCSVGEAVPCPPRWWGVSSPG